MKQKVLILTIFCALSARATPTVDIGGIISPIFSAKTGLIKGAQQGFNKQFDFINSQLDNIANSLKSFGKSSGKGHGKGHGLSAGGLGSGLSAGEFSSGHSTGGNAFEVSNGGYNTLQNTYLPPPSYSSNGGYVYEAPKTVGGGVSSGGSSITESIGGSSSTGLSNSGGGLGGFQDILGSLGKIPLMILTQKKSLINGHLDKKIAHFSKSSPIG